MKKTTAFSLLAMVLIAASAYADAGETETKPEAAVEMKPAAPPPAKAPGKVVSDTSLVTADRDFVTGKVVSVLPSDITRPKGKLVIADRNGAQTEFQMKALAVIYDSKGALMSLTDLRGGQTVRVNYKMIDGKNAEATSVKVLQ